MTSIRARILKENNVIYDGVDVWLKETQGPSHKSWEGYFDLDLYTVDLMSGGFQIILADGRSGEIIVTNVSTGSNSSTEVDFLGAGPLE